MRCFSPLYERCSWLEEFDPKQRVCACVVSAARNRAGQCECTNG